MCEKGEIRLLGVCVSGGRVPNPPSVFVKPGCQWFTVIDEKLCPCGLCKSTAFALLFCKCLFYCGFRGFLLSEKLWMWQFLKFEKIFIKFNFSVFYPETLWADFEAGF